MELEKRKVQEFWDAASCGEELYLKGDEEKDKFKNQMAERYKLEPFILNFANFNDYKGKKVLEIGVGLGADHQMFAEAGANLYGIDLTQRAVDHTQNRLSLFRLSSNLSKGDAENLQFSNNEFDLVYSWGVIHHSPDTKKCVKEIHRVLREGGHCKVMIYHKYSMVGFMLWLRYGLLRMKPFVSLSKIYSLYLESPGTKAYSITEAHALFSDFKDVKIKTILGHGDILSSQAGQRHKGKILSIGRLIYPRFLIKSLLPSAGLFMLIEGRK